jgi:glycosyltransferase involved in cell wall biosynthesis
MEARPMPQPKLWRVLHWLPGKIGAAVRVAVTLMLRVWHIAQAIRRSGAEVVVACSGELFDIPAAAIATRLLRRPLLLYLFDDYLYQWVGGYRRVARLLEPQAVRVARAVIAPNEFLAAAYRTRYGVEPIIVRNPVDPAAVESAEAQSEASTRRPGDPVRIVYTGSVYWAHFDAFRNLSDALKLGPTRARLVVYTAQPPEVLSSNGIAGPVEVHPFVAPPGIYAAQRAADILFLPLAFQSDIPEVVRTSAPGKLGEFLAAGRPLLVHAPADSYVAHYVQTNYCGCVVTEQNPARLAEAVRKLIEDQEYARSLVGNARAAARSFDVNASAATFAAALRKHAGGRHR